MKKNYKDITVILTLYKTPINKLDNLRNYKNYKIIIFDQGKNNYAKKYLKNKLNLNFKYYSFKKNIGLSKASNFLLSKVRTKYCLFTQPDILISNFSIQTLYKTIKKRKDVIFVSPNHKKNLRGKFDYKILKKLNFSCIMCDVKKLNKVGFFDEDFFLYWEDIFLERKINSTKYKMAMSINAFAKHDSSNSSENNYKTDFLRSSNFLFGELVFDFKLKKLRFIKIFRKLTQNIILFIFNILFFQLKGSLKNIAYIIGILKFLIFYISKIK